MSFTAGDVLIDIMQKERGSDLSASGSVPSNVEYRYRAFCLCSVNISSKFLHVSLKLTAIWTKWSSTTRNIGGRFAVTRRYVAPEAHGEETKAELFEEK